MAGLTGGFFSGGISISLTALSDGTTRVYHKYLTSLRYSIDDGATWNGPLSATNGEVIIPTAPGDTVIVDPDGYLLLSVPNAPAAAGYHILMYMGNSAAIGQAGNENYRFPLSAQEFNQDGDLARAGSSFGNGAMVDCADTSDSYQGTDYSPAASYAEKYLELNPSLEGVIIVPECQGGSSLTEEWAIPSGSKTLLATARLGAVYAAAADAGYNITKTVFSYMTLRNDVFTSTSATQTTDFIDRFNAFTDYWRGLSQTESVMAFNTGPSQEWLDMDSNADVDYQFYTQFRRTIAYRKPYADSVDFQGFIQTLFDSIGHADTATNKDLIGPGLAVAANDANEPLQRTEFYGLSFHSDLNGSYPQSVPMWDEVTDTTRVSIPNNHSAMVHENVTASGKTFSGTWGVPTRVFTVPIEKTDNWTILWSGTVNVFDGFFGIFQNINSNVRMYYNGTSGNWTFGTTGASGEVARTVSTDELFSLCMSYDGTTCRLYENGIMVESGPASDNSIGTLAIGAQTDDATAEGVLNGRTQHVAVADVVLTDAQILEYHTVATSI